MYESHFGLNKRPFRALATGSDVFIGPQTAAAMTGFKKALVSSDAIVAVHGPVGVGKTTIVRRALDAISQQHLVITVGRIQLGHDEVLELVLEEMGVELPTGTVQRFTTFRRILKEQADNNTRVLFVVEDAARIGPDALSELEALTASDAGVSDGANIVLMGDEDLNELLAAPRLKRLRQRLRLKQAIAPLSASELMGYCKHCFRLAGKEFDEVFEAGSAEVLHRLTGGVPRLANSLVESSMTSAVVNKLSRVNVAQIKLVASEEFGLDIVEPAPVAEEPPVAVPEAAPAPVDDDIPKLIQDTQDVPQLDVEADDLPDLIQDTQDDLPELQHETLPDLSDIAPQLATAAAAQPEPAEPDLAAAQVEPAPEVVPEWERDPTLAELRPDLEALEKAMAVAQGIAPDPAEPAEAEAPPEEPEVVPEITLDREIQAKIDEAAEEIRKVEEERAAALEDEEPEDNRTVAEILAEAKERKTVDDNSIEAQLNASLDPDPAETLPEIPVLNIPIESDPPSAAAAPPKADAAAEPQPAISAPPETAVETPAPHEPEPEAPAVETPPPLELEPEAPAVATPPPLEPEPEAPAVEPAAEQQPSTQDEAAPNPELQRIAAELSRAKTIDDCDDKMAETLFGEEFTMMAAEVAALAKPDLSANDDIEAEQPAAAIPDFGTPSTVNVELESKPKGLDLTASQRLATVRALNATPDGAAPPGPKPVVLAEEPPATPPPADTPDSIEEQINTSMTQTLKALNARPPEVEDDDDDEKKGGFFSRFKRS